METKLSQPLDENVKTVMWLPVRIKFTMRTNYYGIKLSKHGFIESVLYVLSLRTFLNILFS